MNCAIEMKAKESIVALVIVAVCAYACAAVASELDLTHACIVRAAKENAQQKMAADDLARHLELITGVKPADVLAGKLVSPGSVLGVRAFKAFRNHMEQYERERAAKKAR